MNWCERSARETVAGILGLFALLAIVAHCTGCTPDARRALVETLVDGAACAIANSALPNDQILKVCAIKAADADRILRLVSQARENEKAAASKARIEERMRVRGIDCGDPSGIK